MSANIVIFTIGPALFASRFTLRYFLVRRMRRTFRQTCHIFCIMLIKISNKHICDHYMDAAFILQVIDLKGFFQYNGEIDAILEIPVMRLNMCRNL